jgi:hypothetical protein
MKNYIFLVFFFSNSFAQKPASYHCPIAGSIFSNLTGTPTCFQSLGAVSAADYKIACNKIGSNVLNLLNSDMGFEVISILKTLGYQTNWVRFFFFLKYETISLGKFFQSA